MKLSIKLLELFGSATRKPPYIIFNKDSFPLSSLSMKLFGTVPLMKKLFQVDYESFDILLAMICFDFLLTTKVLIFRLTMRVLTLKEC